MNETAIKDCPFCGSRYLNQFTHGTRFNQIVKCQECKAEASLMTWNLRQESKLILDKENLISIIKTTNISLEGQLALDRGQAVVICMKDIIKIADAIIANQDQLFKVESQ